MSRYDYDFKFINRLSPRVGKKEDVKINSSTSNECRVKKDQKMSDRPL
ncbi:hypothetical protein [Candidatus Nitrosocosmicus franklandus]|nr:hypothetical protein [Candidatus Nitrosocosmicus franklandus]